MAQKKESEPTKPAEQVSQSEKKPDQKPATIPITRLEVSQDRFGLEVSMLSETARITKPEKE